MRAPEEVQTLECPPADLDAAAVVYARRWSGAPPAARQALREELIAACLPFAGRLARRYRGRGEPLEDLTQVARLGLVKAIDRYDPRRGSFTAYAVITITGEIKRHFRDKTWGVHVPRRIQDLSLEVARACTVLTTRLSGSPTVAEIAEFLRVDEDAVIEAIESAASYCPASLNAPVGAGDAGELGDLLGGVDLDLEAVDDKLTVADLLLRMPARERRMLALRFYGNRTQAEIAQELGVSQMHVSRLLSRALTWLREAMLRDTLPRWEGASDGGHDMRVSVARVPGGLTVRVRGEVDRDTAERFRAGLRQAVAAAAGQRIVVDLSGVPLIDAAGLAAFVDARAAAARAEVPLVVRGAQPYVARILAVSGLGPTLAPDQP
ncbi:SigB/SigF/SigG family RNA polymerase sigma factor [Krasilnikovia sp. MM14-A1004]|uniref:SigB/SigF/SigG family RNA polymerase sigma factor n=1 Tax=Krasilnikovia sp. MM14-A1004 TaxID=3373541 RepID=UPI00399D2ACF